MTLGFYHCAASVVSITLLAVACTATPTGTLQPTCTTPDSPDGDEPPCNPNLAQDAWSSAHRNNYAQHSSPLPALAGGASMVRVTHSTLAGFGVPVIITVSEPDQAGHRALWSTMAGIDQQVVKLDPDTLRLLDRATLGGGGLNASGAYNLLDRDQRLIVGSAASLHVYGDAVAGDRHSGIAALRDFTLPASALCRGGDRLVGITMLPDGYVAFATQYGMVGVVPRHPEAMCEATLVAYSINGSTCADSSVPAIQLEQVSNSISADENEGIYVVTSSAQYRIDWDGTTLTRHWRSAYPGAGGTGSGRLGTGSGSTPSLMGTHPDDDRFVVITDGEKLMHLILMWRDEIPQGWQPVAPGLDPRIACDVPLNFGDPAATTSLSEQSVLVRGYATISVNNLLQHDGFWSLFPSGAAELFSDGRGVRPHGIERVDWDSSSRSCRVTWANAEVSVPNGVPAMSIAAGLVYGQGARTVLGANTWTLEAVDFATGASRYFVPLGGSPGENSLYAALTVGPGHSLFTGTLDGITRYEQRGTAGSR